MGSLRCACACNVPERSRDALANGIPVPTFIHATMKLTYLQSSVAKQLSAAQQQLSVEDVELVRQALQQRQASEGHAQAHLTEIERQAEEYAVEGVEQKLHVCLRACCCIMSQDS